MNKKEGTKLVKEFLDMFLEEIDSIPLEDFFPLSYGGKVIYKNVELSYLNKYVWIDNYGYLDLEERYISKVAKAISKKVEESNQFEKSMKRTKSFENIKIALGKREG